MTSSRRLCKARVKRSRVLWGWGIACLVTLAAFAMTVIFLGYFFNYTLNVGVNAIGLNVYGIDPSKVPNLLVWSIILAGIMGFAAGLVIQKIGRKASVILAALVIFICSMKMIYSRSRVAENED